MKIDENWYDLIDVSDEIPDNFKYKIEKIESCYSCRFCSGDQEGGLYCKLIIAYISTKPRKYINFFVVNYFGKCNHYRPIKDRYRLKGVASFNLYEINRQIQVSIRRKEKIKELAEKLKA